MATPDSRTVDPATGQGTSVLMQAAASERRGRARLSALTRCLFSPDTLRVDDAQRGQVLHLLDGLAWAVETDLRRRLADRLRGIGPASLLASLNSATLPIARPWLDAGATLADPDLVAVLARRVDEHRLVTQARFAAQQDPTSVTTDLFTRLLARSEDDVGTLAEAVEEAEVRGFGAFEDPVLDPADLPAEVYHRLVWRTAAAIRRWCTETHLVHPVVADRAIAGAAAGMVSTHDEGRGLDAAAMALARAMLRVGIADDAATVALATEGHVAVAVAGLALRSGLALESTWDMVADRDGARLVVLLRACGMARDAAAALLLRWPDATASSHRIGHAMAGFDDLSATAAADAIDLHRYDPAYARAVADLAGAGA